MTMCPGAMTDGATRILERHLLQDKLKPEERRVFQNAFDHLISLDPSKNDDDPTRQNRSMAWTSGQWMTERTGGSDVSQTETIATYDPFPNDKPTPIASVEENIPLGPWSISGFKWFSSATDSNMTILLAKTSKGLSAFFAPMYRHNPNLVSATGKKGGKELNGVKISRLKEKMVSARPGRAFVRQVE